jgi:hypothetical protein
MQTKSKNDFNDKLQTVFNLMSIKGAYNIVGSASLKGILYNSDYDLNEMDHIKGPDAYDKVYEIFKQKFKVAKSNPNIFITDFKCGTDSNGQPIKWKYNDMIHKKPQFIAALKTKSMIKLDIIYLLNGVYVEITEVYFLDIGNHTNYNNTELDSQTIKSELLKAMTECIKEGLYFKALKRLFSFKNINKRTDQRLINFFNGPNGILYKANADLNVLLTLITNNFREPPIDKIKNNLQIIKQNLSIQDETKKNCSLVIDDICRLKKLNEMYIYIEKLSKYLSRIFNADAKTLYETYYKTSIG